MENFAFEIAKPIMPSDTHIDYIPTQVVAEFLSKVYSFSVEGSVSSISAILFNSAQAKEGVNIAILAEAAYVAYRPKARRSVAEVIDNDFADGFINQERDFPFSPAGKPRGVKISDMKTRIVTVESARFKTEDGDKYDVGLNGWPI